MKRAFLTALAILTLGLAVALPSLPAVVSADTKSEICEGVNAASGGGDCKDSVGRLDKVIDTGINLFSVAVGLVAVVMIMIGGFKYMTAGGESGKLASARNTIIYALIGLVVVALAQSLVKFVLKRIA